MSGRQAEEREHAAHAHEVEREVDRGRRAGHFENDIDALAVGDGIDFALYLLGGHRADVEGVQVGEVMAGRPAPRSFERVIADVGDDNRARAAVLRNRGGHRADRTKAGDGDRLAGHIADGRRVDVVSERVEERADTERYVASEFYDVRGG